MLRPLYLIFGVLMFTSINSSMAAEVNKVSVYINYAGNDLIGQRISSLLEELIEDSPDYKMAPSHEAMMKVTIASLDPDAGRSTGMRSAISTVITMRNYLGYNPADPQTWYPIFLSSNLVVIGSARAEEFASQTLKKVESALERYREDVRKYQ